MRINAERERIFRFKSIAKDTATQYYTILDRFTNELLNPTTSLKNPAGRVAESPLSPKRRETCNMTNNNASNFEVLLASTSDNNKEAAKFGGQSGNEETKAAAMQKVGKNFKQVM